MNKKASLVLSNTYLSGFYKIVDEIAEKVKTDKFSNIILIVPDKFSLNAEQIFMEKIGLPSVFNVWLTTLSRFVSKVTADVQNGLALLSKNSGTMLVGKIIAQNADKIKTYKKLLNSYSLAETMFNAINLLKSSGITPNELKNNFDDTNFGGKIKDLYLVFSEYEKEMKSRVDTTTRLQIFDQKVKTDEYIKNSEIYFSMFESFTNVQMQSIVNLAKYAKSVCVSLCANTIQPNSHIFDNTVFAKLKSTFDDANVPCEISNTTLNASPRQNFLSKNLFAFGETKKFETQDIKLLECANTSDEMRYIASKIKFLVMEKGYIFDDFNIAVNGIDDYALTIQKIFDEFDLPYYIDMSRTMLEHYFSQTLFKIADFVCGQKNQINAVSIANSPIFEIDDNKKFDFENFCQKYNIFGDELYKKFDFENSTMAQNAEEVRAFVFENIKIFESKLSNCKTVFDLKTSLIDYLENIGAEKTLQNIAKNQENLIEKRVDSEVFGKFSNLIDEMDDLICDEKMTPQFFFDMLKSGFSSTNLLTVPLKTDAIFVGDASSSTYYPKKVMFVCGASASRMPRYAGDAGTITDGEIAVFKATNRISPTIKEINKREKFKLFNLLLLPSDRLEITYSTLIGSEVQQKSDFVTAIQNVCTTNGKPIGIEKYELEELKIFDLSNPKSPAYIIGTIKNALKISKGKADNLKLLLEKNLSEVLKREENKYLETNDRFFISDAKKTMFFENKTKVSQIEKYFRCPFMQFVDYGLSPKENQKFSLASLDVGNILHKVAEGFIDKYIKNNYVFENDTNLVVSKIFDNTLMLDEFKNFASNTFALKSLKNEAIRFCEAIKYQIESSDFLPRFAEKKFSGYAVQDGLTISGVVDRIDISKDNNAMRIVDYKTGKDKFSFEDVYYGIKIQLVVYLKVMADILKSRPVATMYMPVKNKFGSVFDAEFASYKLDGVLIDDDGTIKRIDKNLIDNSKSEIVNVEYNKSGDVSANSKKYLLSQAELDELQNYAFLVMQNAIKEMLSGYILPKPNKKGSTYSCDSCKWKSICHYNKDLSGHREIKTKTKKDFEVME